MSPQRRAILSTLAGVLVLVAAGVAGFFRVLSRRPVEVAPVAVPESWAQYRTSAGHEQHVGHGSIACKDCHDSAGAGFTNPGVSVCGHCHEKEATHSHAGGATKTDCLSCHTFAPGAAPTCIDCHREAQGKLASVVQHSASGCSNCHHPHETPALRPACESCHDQRATAHATHIGSKNCLDCHRVHAPAQAALQSCSTCHEKPAGPRPASHDSCLSCHKPHDFVAAGTRACVGCHGAKPTLMSAAVQSHANCTNCHTPHAPAEAPGSCRRCHGEVTAVHAGKETCIDCHVPHNSDQTIKASACTTCHQAIAASDNGAHAGGQSCTNCHKPHTFPAPPRGELCASCHAPETRLTAVSRGHQDCVSCHGASAHRLAGAPACATCHAKEASSAPAGHRECQSCHEPHSGGMTTRGAACTTCHENKLGASHGSTQGGCASCHRPHGPSGVPSPPACVTCHQPSALPALHAVSSHAKCSTCHTSHGPPRSDRATCTTGCHANRKDHQPAAQVCTGCHVFER
jgi:hypothetical protein